MHANHWDGVQIGFGPWRSNLRKSSAIEYPEATFNLRNVP